MQEQRADETEKPIIEGPVLDLVRVRAPVGGHIIVRPRRPKKVSRYDEQLAATPPSEEEFATRVVRNATLEAEYRAGICERKSTAALPEPKKAKRTRRAIVAFQTMRVVRDQAKRWLAKVAADRAVAQGIKLGEGEGAGTLEVLTSDELLAKEAV